MGNRFLASIALFIVASADKTDAELAHVNAPPRLCLLQTKAVRGAADGVHSHEEGVVKVDEELREGHCTPADEAEMKKLGGGSEKGSFPEVLADCGRKAYSWARWRMRWQREK